MPAGADRLFPCVGIAGLGLIGGSVAARLRQALPETRILGADSDEVCARARARGLIDDVRAGIDDMHDADLVVVATPVDVAIDLIRHTSAAFPGLVTDTCSTKRQILAAADGAALPRFVGGHPMAGSEHAGIDHAHAGLFAGQPWYLSSANRSDDADVAALAEWVLSLGARPVRIDAVTHDRTMAYVSHVPQLMAVALMRAAGEACGEAGLQTAGRAFREMTRLASSPPGIWTGILASNMDNVAEAVDAIERHLSAMADGSDASCLDRAFTEARAFRSLLPEPHARPV